MQYLPLFLLLLPVLARAQGDCSPARFRQLMHEVDSVMDRGQYDLAINKLQSAKTCQPDSEAVVNKRVVEVFKTVNRQRELAIDNEREAKKQKKLALLSAEDARIQKDSAVAARDSAQRASDKARIAESNAIRQAKRADSLRVVALDNEQKALVQARTAGLIARANEIETTDPTQALSLVAEACRISSDTNLLALKTRFKLFSNPGHQFALTITSDSSDIYAVAFGPGDTTFFTGTRGGRIHQWSASGQWLRQLSPGNSAVWDLQCSPNGRFLAASYQDGSAVLWDLSQGTKRRLKKEQEKASHAVRFSPDSEKVLVCNYWNAGVYATATGKRVDAFYIERGDILGGGFYGGQCYVFTEGWNQSLVLWTISGEKIRTGFRRKDLYGGYWNMGELDINPVTGSFLTLERFAITLWNVRGERIKKLDTGILNPKVATLSPDGQYLAIAYLKETTVFVYRVEPDKIREVFQLKGHTTEVSSLAFDNSGRYLLTGDKDGQTRYWMPVQHTGYPVKSSVGMRSMGGWNPGRPYTDTNGDVFKGQADDEIGLYSVGLSKNGSAVWASGDDGCLKQWNDRGYETANFTSPGKYLFNQLVVAPDGNSAVAMAGFGYFVFVNRLTGENRLLPLPVLQPTDMAINPVTGHFLVANGFGEVYRFSRQHVLEKRLNLHQNNIHALTVAANGKWFATASFDSTVGIWDMEGRPLFPPKKLAGPVLNVITDTSSSRIATLLNNGTIQLWQVDAPDPLSAVFQHHDLPKAMALSPDGQYLATGSDDLSVQLWAINAPRSDLPLERWEVAYTPRSLAFSPTGDTLYTTGLNGPVRLSRNSRLPDRYPPYVQPWQEDTLRAVKRKAQPNEYYLNTSQITINMPNSDTSIVTDLMLSNEYRYQEYAIRQLEEAPTDTSVRQLLYQVYSDRWLTVTCFGWFDNALQVQQLMEARYPGTPALITRQATLWLFQNRWDDVEALYKKWMDQPWNDPLNPSARFNTYRDAFLHDIRAIKRNGVAHPRLQQAEVLLIGSAPK